MSFMLEQKKKDAKQQNMENYTLILTEASN